MATQEQKPLKVNNWQLTYLDKEKKDPIKILATKIYTANDTNQNHFVCFISLNVKKPETYTRVMQGFNIS